MNSELAISVAELKKTYQGGMFSRGFEALRGISFDVKKGEIFGLTGPNGAGKTTLIKILLGIVSASSGSATVFGHKAGSIPARKLIGYVPENLIIPRHLNGYQALEYYGNLSGVATSDIKAQSQELLEKVGIASRAGDRVTKYSKGMRQRLGLAQALLHKPDILMLDEPTDGLDPEAVKTVRKLLLDLKNNHGVTIFLNSHVLTEVEVICDRVAILKLGQLQHVGTVSEIAAAGGAAATALEVTLELQGDPTQIKNTLDPKTVLTMHPLGGDEHQVLLRLPNQDAVDATVDGLKAAGVKVLGLSRKRITLEDAFINIINADTV